jgi:flagellar biosynthetic protein FliQ
MTPEFITGYFFEALKITFILSGPILIFGLVAGVVVAIFQAATSINEMTLVFIPKMIAVGIGILIFFPWMLQVLVSFTENIFINIPSYIK